MATGDTADQLSRIKRYLPQSWFGDASPILDGLLSAIATVNSFVYGLIQYAQLQTRIITATDGFLDLAASDFFGAGTIRAAGQSDAAFRNLIIINLFRPRATRAALSQVLFDLTGREPIIFEPSRIQDTGAYSTPNMGYGVAGRYGSLLLPFQAFVTAFRPVGSGIPNVAGYGISTGGYSTPSQAEYASLDMIQDVVTDADIYAAIDGVKPAGTIIWTRFGNSQPALPPPSFSLILGGSPINFRSSSAPIRLLGWQL